MQADLPESPGLGKRNRAGAVVATPAPPGDGAGALCLGALRVRLARTPHDIDAVAILRGQRFGAHGPAGRDHDAFDDGFLHLMVEDTADDALLATARLRLLRDGGDFAGCYTGQSYGLAALARHFPRALEIGRLCLAPDLRAEGRAVGHAGGTQPAEVLRALLAGVTQQALAGQAQALLGCASFIGADPARHARALGWLWAHHAGPRGVQPDIRAPRIVRHDPAQTPDATDIRGVPALLRMYLALGGWVSDHAVIDPELDTLHVLTVVPVATIPPTRLRALRALTGQGGCL